MIILTWVLLFCVLVIGGIYLFALSIIRIIALLAYRSIQNTVQNLLPHTKRQQDKIEVLRVNKVTPEEIEKLCVDIIEFERRVRRAHVHLNWVTENLGNPRSFSLNIRHYSRIIRACNRIISYLCGDNTFLLMSGIDMGIMELKRTSTANV